MTDQRKLRQNVCLENMNMTSNYDVAKNAHPIQMTPYATEWNPHENFLRTPLEAGNASIKLAVEEMKANIEKAFNVSWISKSNSEDDYQQRD